MCYFIYKDRRNYIFFVYMNKDKVREVLLFVQISLYFRRFLVECEW